MSRRSHFYCEVESSRTHTEKICSRKDDGLEVTAAGWKGAIKVYIRHFGDEDHFEIRFIPWLKSESDSSGITLASGKLNYDMLGVRLEQAGDSHLIRLDHDGLQVLEFLKAKKIMLEGIPNITD